MANQTPYSNFNFKVEIDGIPHAAFSEVGISEATTDAIEYREGTEPAHVRKLSGLTKYSNLTLRRGVTGTNELFDWFKSAGSQRRTVVVQLLDEQQSPVKRWVMRNVWPVRYAVSPLVATDGCAVVTETLECAVEHLEAEAL